MRLSAAELIGRFSLPFGTENAKASMIDIMSLYLKDIDNNNIYPNEIENVAFDDEPWIKKGRMGTRYLLGYTVTGRYLFVVYVLRSKGMARVITAMDMDEKRGK